MIECNKTKKELIYEIVELRRQIAELKVLEALYMNGNRGRKIKSVCDEDLKSIVRQHNGIIFKYSNAAGRLIYTFCEGELLYRWGFIPEQIIGRGILETNLLRNPNFPDCFVRAWKGEEVFFEEVKSNGTVITLVLLSPIRNKGKVIEVIGLCIDISELKRKEQSLRKTEKMEMISHLVAGIAHEIRNPLTSIKGFLRLIELTSIVDSPEYFEIIKSELCQIENVINKILFLNQSQKSIFQKQNMPALLDCVLSILSPQAIISNVQIITSVEDNLPHLCCDDNQLKQVFFNIIKNAIEAMPSGGIVRIVVQQSDEDTIKIQCIDQGCGMEEERILKLGEPFYDIKEKGIGLGLMISFKIIEAHQGKIVIHSKVNVGTTVEITLPIHPFQP